MIRLRVHDDGRCAVSAGSKWWRLCHAPTDPATHTEIVPMDWFGWFGHGWRELVVLDPGSDADAQRLAEAIWPRARVGPKGVERFRDVLRLLAEDGPS